jgi:hypothetical protein
MERPRYGHEISSCFTNRADGVLFDFSMTRDAGVFAVCWIQPNRVRAAFVIEPVAVAAQVPLRLLELHAFGELDGFSNGSRR